MANEPWQLTAVQSASARISELARTGGLDQPVPHLNRWKVRDVVAHLGGVQRWATRIVAERSMAGPGFKKSKLDGTELCDWFDAGVTDLLATFRGVDLGEQCPNFNPGSESTVAFWARRQAHEATVHRWDVEQALEVPTGMDAAAAADGIDEFLDVFVRTRGKQTLASTLILRTTRPKREWTLTPGTKPGRIDVASGRPAGEDAGSLTDMAEVSGRPQALLLALWGRQSIGEAGLTISGEPATAHSLFSS